MSRSLRRWNPHYRRNPITVEISLSEVSRAPIIPPIVPPDNATVFQSGGLDATFSGGTGTHSISQSSIDRILAHAIGYWEESVLPDRTIGHALARAQAKVAVAEALSGLELSYYIPDTPPVIQYLIELSTEVWNQHSEGSSIPPMAVIDGELRDYYDDPDELRPFLSDFRLALQLIIREKFNPLEVQDLEGDLLFGGRPLLALEDRFNRLFTVANPVVDTAQLGPGNLFPWQAAALDAENAMTHYRLPGVSGLVGKDDWLKAIEYTAELGVNMGLAEATYEPSTRRWIFSSTSETPEDTSYGPQSAVEDVLAAGLPVHGETFFAQPSPRRPFRPEPIPEDVIRKIDIDDIVIAPKTPGWKHTHTLHWYHKPRDSDEYRSLETPNIQGETGLYYPAGSFPLIYLEGEAIQARNMSSGAFWGSLPVYKVDVVSEKGWILYSNLYSLDENGEFTNFYGAKVRFPPPLMGWEQSPSSPTQPEYVIKNGVITLRGIPVPPFMGIRLMGPDSILEGPDPFVERFRYLDLSVSKVDAIEKELSEVLNEMARLGISLSADPRSKEAERYNQLVAKKEELSAELEELSPHIPDDEPQRLIDIDDPDLKGWDPTHVIHIEVKKEGRHGPSRHASGSWEEDIPVMLLPWTDAQIARLALLETHARPELEALGYIWTVRMEIIQEGGDTFTVLNVGQKEHTGYRSWAMAIYPDGRLEWRGQRYAPIEGRLDPQLATHTWWPKEQPEGDWEMEPWLAEEPLSILRDLGYNTYSILTYGEDSARRTWISRTASSSFTNQEPLLYHLSGLHEDCRKTPRGKLTPTPDSIKGEFAKKLWREIYKPPPGYDLCLHAVLRHKGWEPTRHILLRRRNSRRRRSRRHRY